MGESPLTKPSLLVRLGDARFTRAYFAEHAHGWELAIVDLFLKQGSGLGILDACRDRDASQRVVVLSNYATADMRKRCADLGADAVLRLALNITKGLVVNVQVIDRNVQEALPYLVADRL